MLYKRFFHTTVAVITAVFMLATVSVSALSSILKKEMEGSEVTALQKDLKKLGYLSVEPTGYYGDMTVEAIKKLQKEYGYDADGMTGSITGALIDRLLGRTAQVQATSVKTTSIQTTSIQTTSVKTTPAATVALKKGMEGSAVVELQKSLIKLGFLSTQATGLYGDATTAAVKKLQKKYGYEQDGIAGSNTLALVKKLVAESQSAAVKKTTTATTATTTTASKTSTAANAATAQASYLLPWFDTVKNSFKISDVATIYDIKSGISFKVKRTYGHNHADCEPLTAADTAIMKKIFGGEWTWDRRAVIITTGTLKIAASIAGMPHAGIDKYAANATISSRSGGFGRGDNLDAVKGNNMNGHFDIHFFGSKTHGTNRPDVKHQRNVREAADWARKNL